MEGLLQKSEDETFAHKEARFFAFWAIVVSTTALLVISISIPIMFVHMHSLGSDLHTESDFCKVRVRDMWTELYKLSRDGHLPKARQQREKRHWQFGEWVPDLPIVKSVARAAPIISKNLSTAKNVNPSVFGVALSKDVPDSNPIEKEESAADFSAEENEEKSTESEEEEQTTPQSKKIETGTNEETPYESSASLKSLAYCACRKQGPPGPRGLPGEPGKKGKDGSAGMRGKNGRDGSVMAADVPLQEPCVMCPVGPPGPPGLQGPKGPNGPRGSHGTPGVDGKRGEPGMAGPVGPPGQTGAIGKPGPPGVSGRVLRVEGARGPKGKPGLPGLKGLQGCQGEMGSVVSGPKGEIGLPGRPGRDGRKGSIGEPGLPGGRGFNGDCNHCAPARLPPGY